MVSKNRGKELPDEDNQDRGWKEEDKSVKENVKEDEEEVEEVPQEHPRTTIASIGVVLQPPRGAENSREKELSGGQESGEIPWGEIDAIVTVIELDMISTIIIIIIITAISTAAPPSSISVLKSVAIAPGPRTSLICLPTHDDRLSFKTVCREWRLAARQEGRQLRPVVPCINLGHGVYQSIATEDAASKVRRRRFGNPADFHVGDTFGS
ncbi:hypothetical protein QYE76_048574 [Lolium multiflorum]|uniref:Uncharacterized protein n=1 Tax=Lolium multiflorum TaxID=4521 RepID=A0AAD8WHH0_LOLMU|nr:hypothetical protein QYE76_048574 [Lolium multiflorum]